MGHTQQWLSGVIVQWDSLSIGMLQIDWREWYIRNKGFQVLWFNEVQSALGCFKFIGATGTYATVAFRCYSSMKLSTHWDASNALARMVRTQQGLSGVMIQWNSIRTRMLQIHWREWYIRNSGLQVSWCNEIQYALGCFKFIGASGTYATVAFRCHDSVKFTTH